MSFKSSETQQQSSNNSSTTPSTLQLPYLQQAFQGAQGALQQAQTATAPTNFTAQFTPEQLNAFQTMLNYGMAPSASAAGATAAGTTLTGAGSNAATSGLTNLQGYTPGQITQNNIDAANKYVAGQDIPGQVDAAMLDARRNASENVLPGLYRAAAGSGNINSNKSALAEGVVDRGLAEQAGGLSSQLRANAFTNGLNLGQQGNNSAITAALGSVSGGDNSVNTGVNAGTGGINQQAGLFNIANTAIGNQNNAAQAGLTNEEQQFQAQTNDPFAALNNFYNLIGNKAWGQNTTGSGTTNTQSTPSGMSILGGLLAGAGGAFKF